MLGGVASLFWVWKAVDWQASTAVKCVGCCRAFSLWAASVADYRSLNPRDFTATDRTAAGRMLRGLAYAARLEQPWLTLEFVFACLRFGLPSRTAMSKRKFHESGGAARISSQGDRRW